MGSRCSSNKVHYKEMANVSRLRAFMNYQVKAYPFSSLSEVEQAELENEYINGNFSDPYSFLREKNLDKKFVDLYEICYLKCKPLIENIIEDDHQKGNLLFFRLVIFLMTDVTDINKKKGTAKSILNYAYNQIHNQYHFLFEL